MSRLNQSYLGPSGASWASPSPMEVQVQVQVVVQVEKRLLHPHPHQRWNKSPLQDLQIDDTMLRPRPKKNFMLYFIFLVVNFSCHFIKRHKKDLLFRNQKDKSCYCCVVIFFAATEMTSVIVKGQLRDENLMVRGRLQSL